MPRRRTRVSYRGIPSMSDVCRVGNAQGFWGDDIDAPVRMATLDLRNYYLTLDYLAEVTMSILARQKARSGVGYARDFVDVVEQVIAVEWGKPGLRTLRMISNAGGLEPKECARACLKKLQGAGVSYFRVGTVSGDDLMPHIDRLVDAGQTLENSETGEPFEAIRDRLVTANAYLGAWPVVDALKQGAKLVITGRIADPSMTVAAAIHTFGWTPAQRDALAGATIAGHLIECGAQVTGGISTHWGEVPNPEDIGYPVVEITNDGRCVVTKPDGTGGHVTPETVKEQLVYEIGDPANYLSPDVTVDFRDIWLDEIGKNRISVNQATGRPPPTTYKVSATYLDGYRATGTLTLVAPRRAKRLGMECGRIVNNRVERAGFKLENLHTECIGGDDEVVIRMTATDHRKEAVERFAKEIAPLVTTGPQGITGYAAGRPRVQEVFAYWPTIVCRTLVDVEVSVEETRWRSSW